MSWLENRANAVRGVSPDTNTPNPTNQPKPQSPTWLTNRANTARQLQPIQAPQPTQIEEVQTPQKKSGNVVEGFKTTIKSFWDDIQKDGIGGAIAKRMIPADKQQPEEVVQQNMQTFAQRPLQEAQIIERGGRDLATGFVGAVKPVLDFMSFAYTVDKDTMDKVANAEGQPTLLKNLFKNYGEMQGARGGAVSDVSKEVQKIEEKIAVKDPNTIDQIVQAFGSTLSFFVAGVASGSAYLPALLETYGNMGEVVNRTEGKPLENRVNRVVLDGAVNGLYNYFTDKFGLFSTEKVGLKKLLTGFVAEGTQEGTQALMGNVTSTEAWDGYWKKLVENKMNGKYLFDGTRPFVEEMFAGVKENALIGGLMGTMFSLADLSPTTQEPLQQQKEEPSKDKEQVPETGSLEDSRMKNLENTNKKMLEALRKYDTEPVKEGFTRVYYVIEKGQTTNWRFGTENELRQFIGSNDTSTSDIIVEDVPTDTLEKQSNGAYIVKEQVTDQVKTKIEPAEFNESFDESPVEFKEGDLVVDTKGRIKEVVKGNDRWISGAEKDSAMKDQSIGFLRTKVMGETKDFIDYANRVRKLTPEEIASIKKTTTEKPVTKKPTVKKTVKTKEPTIQEGIKALENQMNMEYSSKEQEVEQALSEIWAELEVAEAGQRVFFDQQDTSDMGVIGIKSTFPKWIPEELRSKDLFNAVMQGLSDPKGFKYPEGNKTKQRALYDAILDEIDSRAGIDTGLTRSAIIERYENLIKEQKANKQPTRQTKKTVRRSTKGSEGTDAKTETEVKRVFYRGKSGSNKQGNYYTSNLEFAREFSNGLPEDIEAVNISDKDIFRDKPVPEATNESQVTNTMNKAKKGGYKAFYVDEGSPFGEPVESVFVMDKTAVKVSKEEVSFSDAKKTSVEQDPRNIAKTPEQLKELIDNLNRYGQSYAILRKTGGLSGSMKGAVGLFVQPGKSKKARDVAKEGQVRLKADYIAQDENYISTLAHELGHATEFHLTGATNKKTMQVFGDKLTPEQKSTVMAELVKNTKVLVGEATVAKQESYYMKPTELLARFFEMYITNPELLAENAPTALELITEQSVKHPMIREFMEIIDDNMMRKDRPNVSFLPDLRQTYQKALGSKRVGNIAYNAEIQHRAMVERAKKILPEFIASKFKGVKDSPELLFRVAESIKVTKDGVPEFGTRDYVYLETKYYESSKADKLRMEGYEYVATQMKDGVETDTWAKTRYTPAEAEAMFGQLSEQGKQLIRDFTAQRSEAKDYFNREVIKDVNNINSNLEGWVHHFFEEGKTTTVGKSMRFRVKKAGATMRRTGSEGYVEDLQKAVTKAVVELEVAKSFNNFIDKQFARVSKPIPEGQNPDAGWVEVMGNLRKGVGLEGDTRTTVITGDKAVRVKSTRYQVPRAVYERYALYRGLVEEASTVTKWIHRLNNYWAINILTDVGTAGTNFIGGGIQYSAKVLTDFYTETLTGNIAYPQTRRDVNAMLKVLLPKGWHNAPDWVYGADLSNWYGQFSQKQVSKADKALDAFADKNLKLFGSIERYWKKVIMLSENVSDVKSLENVGLEGLRVPTKEEENMIAKINKEVDLFAFDYDNIPLWLTRMKKNPVGAGVKPFATYPYKYAKMITNMVGSAFDPQLSWQDRSAKILALSTLMAIYAAFSLDRKKKQQTPEGTNPEIEIRAKSAGNLYTGITDAEGNELFVRVSKYPFFGLTEAGIQTMRGNSDSASNIFKEMIGSIGFIGKTGLNIAGYRDQYEKYDPTEVVLGNNLSGLVPYTRILDEISRGLDPYKRKQTTFGQTFTRLVPTTNEDLQNKLHGDIRTIKVPIEGDVKRTPGTAYARTTIDRTLKNYWQDILLSSLTGIYIKRVNPKDVEAQLIRDEKNKKEQEKKRLKGSK